MNIKIFIIALVLIFLVIVIIGLARTYKTQTSKNQESFIDGTLPNPAPDGDYAGTVTGYHGNWRGKKFTAAESKGVNIFEDSPNNRTTRYNFQTKSGQAIRDHETQVLRIEYNISGNPLWIRPVLDEIVQVGENEYLGKIHYRLIPGVPFSIGYFRLKR